MITVVPFIPAHLERIELQEAQANECPKTVMNAAFTFMRGETVVAIIGGFMFIPGVIHFWALLSEHIHKYPVAFHKECLKAMRWYEKTEKPRRIQWEVRADFKRGQRWAEAMGLKKEGLMKAWMPDGTDAYLYGRSVCQQ
jgi:hypothetical protein